MKRSKTKGDRNVVLYLDYDNLGWYVAKNTQYNEVGKPLYESNDVTECGLLMCQKYCEKKGYSVKNVIKPIVLREGETRYDYGNYRYFY